MAIDSRPEARGGAQGMSRWSLTSESLSSLLDFLGPDPESAARQYEAVRTKLHRIFEWRGCGHPEELADETMNRVAHKLASGLEVRADDPFRYFCGVAFMVFKEQIRADKRQRDTLAAVRHQPPPPQPEEEDERMSCLRQCLDRLDAESRDLLLRYHSGDGQVRIAGRKRLAAELAVPLNALRIRAHRLRGKLEECVRSCMGIA